MVIAITVAIAAFVVWLVTWYTKYTTVTCLSVSPWTWRGWALCEQDMGMDGDFVRRYAVEPHGKMQPSSILQSMMSVLVILPMSLGEKMARPPPRHASESALGDKAQAGIVKIAMAVWYVLVKYNNVGSLRTASSTLASEESLFRQDPVFHDGHDDEVVAAIYAPRVLVLGPTSQANS